MFLLIANTFWIRVHTHIHTQSLNSFHLTVKSWKKYAYLYHLIPQSSSALEHTIPTKQQAMHYTDHNWNITSNSEHVAI